MPKTNLKSLIGKLNSTCRSALESAAGLCLSQTHYEVELEHFLLKLLEMPDTDFQKIIRHFEINETRLTSDLTRAMEGFKTGNARNPDALAAHPPDDPGCLADRFGQFPGAQLSVPATSFSAS